MRDIEVGFPFQLDATGRVASPAYDVHVEQLIELVLFTSPGERVNRPDFGCGLLSTIFASLNDEERTAVQFLVQSSLQKWLGDVIQVQRVEVTIPAESTLRVTVQYFVLRDRQSRLSSFDFQRAA